MYEPTSTTSAATLAAGSVALPALTIAGIPLGLRPDILIAGFAGSLVAIILLNSVPATGDTWMALLRHERKHLEQIERDGRLLFSIKYLYWICRYGYKNCPYEIEARAAERKTP